MPSSRTTATTEPGASRRDAAVHPALVGALARLEDRAVPWAVLRGSGDGAEDEIDVIVPPVAIAGFAAAVGAAGFARFPAAGHGRHRFYRTYDPASDRWLTLDVVDELGFGRDGALVLPVDVGAIVERRRASSVPRLADDDAFWGLLLHDLLDRRSIPDHHRAQLEAVADAARPDGPLASAIDRVGGTGTAAELLRLVRAGDDRGALERGARLARRWRRGALRVVVRRRVAGVLARRARKLHTAAARRGIDVAVLGPDGAGKSTLTERLAATMPIPTRRIYLGVYGAGAAAPRRFGLPFRVGRLWRGWLVGAFHRLRGRVVVYDRHGLDAVGSSGGPLRRRVRRWVLAHALPSPALVIVLDAPGALLHARKGEHDPERLDAMRAAYRRLAEDRKNVVVVDASGDADGVRRAATAAIWDRWGRGRRDG